MTGAKCVGIEALKVMVEVDVTSGIGIHLVGLADAAVKESLLRTITALQAIGYRIPGKKIVINLAPADLRKNGSGYDLPIAVGIIAASGQAELPLAEQFLIMGELGLDASVRPVPGALPFCTLAQDEGLRGCILPISSALEAVGAVSTPVYGVRTLQEVLSLLAGEQGENLLARNSLEYSAALSPGRKEQGDVPDFSDIVGQEGAKRGVEIASCGNHNVIMVGPPGAGKSLLAKAMAGILPPMDAQEAMITSKIYAIAGKSIPSLVRNRPFRAPHYSASMAAMIGGGGADNILPGEISLAQGGILFIDEFGQMPKSVVEALRAPLEDRKVTISRLRMKVEYPASFMLVAASNPCPCGYWGDGDSCTCTPSQRLSYLSRLSGPVLDRIDIQLRISGIAASDLVRGDKLKGERETSAEVARRVAMAREIQRRRFEGTGIFTNAEMSARQIEEFCPLSEECRNLMERMIDKMGFSARAYSRVRRIARTIADLASARNALLSGTDPVPGPILPEHLSEAASYRFLDRRSIVGF